jgi:hypothetical protein
MSIAEMATSCNPKACTWIWVRGKRPSTTFSLNLMNIDQLINVLVTVTLIEMMVAIGLTVRFSDLLVVITSWPLVL